MTEHALHPTAGPDTRSTPLISVVMPVRGRPYTLAKTVESILNQTFEEFEFIVVLDGFDLETEQILAKIQDPRLRIVISPENVGIPKALNLGLRNARGKYFARMDNGDFAEPYRLKDHLDSVANGAQVSFCQAAIVEPDGAIIEETVNQPWLLRIWSSMFCQSLGTAGSALFAEVELLRSTGGFDETYRFAQDYEISERLASQGKEFAYTDRLGIRVPMYEDGISKRKRVAQEEFTRNIMARASRRYLPSLSDKQLVGLSVWRGRFRLEGEVDPMPGVRVLPSLAKAFLTSNKITRLPFSIANDIAQHTEPHLKDLPLRAQLEGLGLIFWCAWKSRSLRLWKYAIGCLKRLAL